MTKVRALMAGIVAGGCIFVSACQNTACRNNVRTEATTESIHNAALAWFDDAAGRVDALVPIAEQITDRLLAGGKMYVAGDPGFCDELNFRAGGFAFIKVLEQGQRLTNNDVLIIGRLSQNDSGTRAFRMCNLIEGRGQILSARTIYIASCKWPQVDRAIPVCSTNWEDRLTFLDTRAPSGSSLSDIAIGQMSTVAMAYTLEAEIISALTRRGRTPAVLGSVYAPGAKEWNQKIGKDSISVPDVTVPPIAAGKLGREYLSACRRQAAAFLKTGQADQLRLGAKRLVEAFRHGGVAWTITLGHVHTRGAIIPRELPNIFIHGPAWEWDDPVGTKPGDVLLYMGYGPYPQAVVDKMGSNGVEAVVFSRDPGKSGDKVTNISTCWDGWDACVELPNYPYRALPSSGVVTTLQWYSLMAETMVLMSNAEHRMPN